MLVRGVTVGEGSSWWCELNVGWWGGGWCWCCCWVWRRKKDGVVVDDAAVAAVAAAVAAGLQSVRRNLFASRRCEDMQIAAWHVGVVVAVA